MARSPKLCILRKSGKQDLSGLGSGTKLSGLDSSQTDNITNGNTQGLQPYPKILTSPVWHVLLVQPCSATSFLTLATVTGILELETKTNLSRADCYKKQTVACIFLLLLYSLSARERWIVVSGQKNLLEQLHNSKYQQQSRLQILRIYWS